MLHEPPRTLEVLRSEPPPPALLLPHWHCQPPAPFPWVGTQEQKRWRGLAFTGCTVWGMEAQSGQIIQKRLHIAVLSVPQLGRGKEPGAEICRGQKVGVFPALPPPQLDSDPSLSLGAEGLAASWVLVPKAWLPQKACPEKPTLSLQPHLGPNLHQDSTGNHLPPHHRPLLPGASIRPLCGAQRPGGQGQLV